MFALKTSQIKTFISGNWIVSLRRIVQSCLEAICHIYLYLVVIVDCLLTSKNCGGICPVKIQGISFSFFKIRLDRQS